MSTSSSAQTTSTAKMPTNPFSSPQPQPQSPNRAKRLSSSPSPDASDTPSSRRFDPQPQLRSPLARMSTTSGSYFSRPARVQSTHSSTHLTLIGNLLSTPYDSDSEDEVLTPHQPHPSSRPRAGTVQKYLSVPKIVRSHVSRSQIGEIEEDLDGDVIAFDRPCPVPSKRDWRQSNESGILIYPPGSMPHTPPRYPARTHPTLFTPPATTSHRPGQALTPGLKTPRPITPLSLPPPASPISPLLAAPPRPHFNSKSSPSSPFSNSDNRSSTSSDSTCGYQLMLEKKALFRSGDEELMSPFSMSTESFRQEKHLVQLTSLINSLPRIANG
ncbi:MAG: hypothetical protein TREMPRED_003503 [Tremellales sp. Tagirdzhanova-0007]|nr:MAG: hypothetical protein TREMPRED_003503 [Tremellales sp. Tagirdzhanova-0007]